MDGKVNKEYSTHTPLLLFLRGFAMGTADIIPGVSGGTIAFITGIYSRLVDAIRSVDWNFFKLLASGRIRQALNQIPWAFLIPLGTGILLALVSTARLTHFLLEHHPVAVWSFFFGLILASILVVGRRIGRLSPGVILLAVIGAIFSYCLVRLTPVSLPDHLWIIFGCGMIAICAMILPGISGAMILLILGKYELITGALKSPFVSGNFTLLCVFAAGCAVGIMGFSRVLHFFLNKYWQLTMGFLTGVMIGALAKVWPWKEVLETTLVRGKSHVLSDRLVLPGSLNQEVIFAIGLMLAGLLLVLSLEWVAIRVGSSPYTTGSGMKKPRGLERRTKA